jgi:hypothetical protein
VNDRTTGSQIKDLLDWQKAVLVLPFPGKTNETVLAAHLSAAQWPAFQKVLVWSFTAYGQYGTGVRPAHQTIGDAHGLSRQKVQRWFKAAEGLGFIIRRSTGGFDRANSYDIVPGFEPLAAVRLDSLPDGQAGPEGPACEICGQSTKWAHETKGDLPAGPGFWFCIAHGRQVSAHP